jgi:uncharacterized Zn finger protein
MVTVENIQKAKQRALDLGVAVWVLEPGRRYVAPSGSNAGTAYEIVIQSSDANDLTCSCPAGTHRGICKHIGAVMVALDAEKPVPPPKPERSLEDKLADLDPSMRS